MKRSEDIELLVAAAGILAGVTGYLLDVPAMTFFGILFAAIAFGVRLGRSLIDRAGGTQK
jgi:hypothetical protein